MINFFLNKFVAIWIKVKLFIFEFKTEKVMQSFLYNCSLCLIEKKTKNEIYQLFSVFFCLFFVFLFGKLHKFKRYQSCFSRFDLVLLLCSASNKIDQLFFLFKDYTLEPITINTNVLEKAWSFDRQLIDSSLTIRLFTKEHNTRAVLLTRSANEFELEGFNDKYVTFFLIHGWMSGYSTDSWMDVS